MVKNYIPLYQHSVWQFNLYDSILAIMKRRLEKGVERKDWKQFNGHKWTEIICDRISISQLSSVFVRVSRYLLTFSCVLFNNNTGNNGGMSTSPQINQSKRWQSQFIILILFSFLKALKKRMRTSNYKQWRLQSITK